jgi:AcrR family transcriptional regulator
MSASGASKFVARKRQERGERRIASIVAEASKLFAARGFDGTAMSAIAQAAGISIGSLYQYFPNKDAIVDALADEYVRSWREITPSAGADEVPLHDLIHDGIEKIVDFTGRHAAIKAFLDADPARAPSIRALQDEVEIVIPLLARHFPRASHDALAGVIFVSGAIIRGVAAEIAAEPDRRRRAWTIDEVTAAVEGYLTLRLGKPRAT